jgi:hypothetical protein
VPVAGGYDVQLGSVKYVLDRSKEEPYAHYLRQIDDGERSISGGDPNAVSARSDLLRWDITDWSGGEGARRWYKDDPTVYDYADGLNGRIPGQITGRPARGSVSFTMDDQREKPFFAIGQGRLWLGISQTLKWSSDQGATWTDRTSALNLAAGWKITAMAGNHEGVFVFARNSTNRIVRFVSSSSASDCVASHAATAPWIGASFMGGRLYGWTGRKLFEFDVTATFPLTLNSTYRKVDDTGVDLDYANFGGTSAGSWWGDAQPTENSVIYFVGTEGQTNVYEYDTRAGTEIWRMPFGFTGKSMKVQGGIVYVGGHWSGESDATGGFGELYAMPIDSLIPTHVCWFRKHDGNNFQMQEMANSYGDQIMIAAAKTGKVFIYDADYDAPSLLDDLANGANDKIGDMITVGQKRVVAVYSPGAGSAGTTITLYRYSSDEPGDRESSGSLSNIFESGEYDFDRPYDAKTLEGFHVTFKPLLTNQRIKVSYSLDGAAFVDTTVITSATSGADSGRVFVPVVTGSSDARFFRLEVKATLDNNATSSVKQPILFAVSAQARVVQYEEVWELFLRVKDEHQKSGRGASRAVLAERLRDNLWDLADNKTYFDFKDGARYASKSNYTSDHVVRIEVMRDVIENRGAAEGSCFVRLVARAS